MLYAEAKSIRCGGKFCDRFCQGKRRVPARRQTLVFKVVVLVVQLRHGVPNGKYQSTKRYKGTKDLGINRYSFLC